MKAKRPVDWERSRVTVTEHWSKVFPKGQGSREHLLKFMTMGDMKTPDFDDLLAAFDIPDIVDPKAATESGHNDHEKPHEAEPPSSSDVGVSVIIKNVGNIHFVEGREKDGHNPTGNGLHNGFLIASSLDSYSKDGVKSLKGDVPAPEVTLKDSTFSQFSPISSAEEFDDDEKTEEDMLSCRSNLLTESAPRQGYDKLKALGRENSSKTGLSTSGNMEENKVVKREAEANSINLSVYEPFKVRKNDTSLSGTKSSSKLSSCIAAIAALSAKKAASDSCKEPVANSRESSLLPKEANDSRRQPDSPRSISSENNSKGSPSSPAGSTPAIPKVRIKTIKTSSGEIKRTVTRLLPEVDHDSGKKPSEQTASLIASVTSILSSPASEAVLSSPPRAPFQSVVMTTWSVSPAELTPKQVTIKPVATVFLPVSTVKTAGSQVINLKLANTTTVKLRVISAASVLSASSAIIKATNTIQHSLSTPQKCVSSPDDVVLAEFCGEAFNKVLSSVNPVPVYIPNLSPPANAGITLLMPGYKCLECGDSFALEKSLTQHSDRRSMRIEVTCNHCTKNLVFYNKCSLLSHARGHKEKGVVMQCSHLILKPVPADQMIVSPSSNTSTSTSTLQSPVGAGTHTLTKIQSGITGTVISAPSSTSITPAMPLDEDPSKLCRHSLQCLECCFLTGAVTHHTRESISTNLPTPALSAGAFCRSVHFQTHVTKNCLNYTRRVGFQCVHCNVVYSDVAALKSHIQGSHCEVFYKCLICPVAFKSAPSTHSHAYLQHPGIKIGEPKIIYKCSMCNTVFTLQTLLYRHFDQYIENQKASVFKCPDCSLLYAQKQLMRDHTKSMHGTLKSIEGPPNLGLNLPLSIKPATQNSANQNKEDTKSMTEKEKLEKKSPSLVKKSMETKKVASPGWTCWECDRLFMQRDVYISHVRKEHGKQVKKHPCCQRDKPFSLSYSLCRHNRIKHKGIRKVYACSHCPDSRRTFTRLMLKKHVQLMHDSTNEEEAEIKEDTKVPSPKWKLKKPVLEFRPPRGAITQPLKKLKINVFKVHKCAVCGSSTENLLQFHEHIPQHKSDGSSYQCWECGLCYTSHISLSRHLFIVHTLREPQPVSKQNGAGDDNQRENKPSHEDESPDGAVSDRKCKVCAKTVETEAALNTHMRTHGMAFIKSKRMSSAEK
uniref:C2H2-type domain-containing protein n=1 Tax=Macaca nemestrina TaxID=9545 RepID=A0A2K6DGP6_MACNE